MKKAILNVIIVIVIMYLYHGTEKGFNIVNSELFDFISENPMLSIILFFGAIVFVIPSEKKMLWIRRTYYSAFILLFLAFILYLLDLHGYNMKLAMCGIGLFFMGAFLTITSGTAWIESLSRDDKSIDKSIKIGWGVCPKCYKKISRAASRCPYCTSEI